MPGGLGAGLVAADQHDVGAVLSGLAAIHVVPEEEEFAAGGAAALGFGVCGGHDLSVRRMCSRSYRVALVGPCRHEGPGPVWVGAFVMVERVTGIEPA